MSPDESAATRALLEESAWLHRLARRLVADPHGAEDAAQAALLAGLERPSRASALSHGAVHHGAVHHGTAPLRRWLAGVLRNLVRAERRGSARRAARERERAAPLEGESADEVGARLELQERLVALVRALPEPYRTTIALRFLADLSPREVAARTGVPLKTVHTRIERALARLRAELDRAHGGRDAWAGILLLAAPALPAAPLSPSPAAPAGAAVLAPMVAMGTVWKWAGAAAALALIGYVVVQERPPSGREVAPLAGEPSASPLERAAPPPAREEPELVAREPLASEPTPSAPAVVPNQESAPPAAPRVSGRVVDLERRGLAGLDVRFEPTSHPDQAIEPGTRGESTTSGADGAFELAMPGERGRLLAEGRGYATLISAGLNGNPPPEPPLVIVAPAHDYAGVVVDPSGAPVGSVELFVRISEERARALQPGVLANAVPLARARTDADGAFRMERVAFAEGVALEADYSGYRMLRAELPDADDLALRVVLEPLEPLGPTVAGIVRFADGAPAAGAWVSAGGDPGRARADGSFAVAPAQGAAEVLAVHPGWQPARAEIARLDEEQRQRLVLELAAPALSISGTVVDAEGRAIKDAQVWTNGGEVFGMLSQRFGEVDFYVETDVEELLAADGEERRDRRAGTSNSSGAFRLEGLLEREYDVFALHPRTQEMGWVRAVPAGEDALRLVLGGAEPAREVRGRVVTLSGEPVEGALIRVWRKRDFPDGTSAFKQCDMDFFAATDADGRFRFDALCVEGTHLLLNGETIAAAQERALDDEPDLLDVTFRAPAVCHLRVSLIDPGRADSLTLLDAEDRPLSLTFQVGSVTLGAESVQVEDGVSDLLRTDESARTLVLSKDGVQERVPIRLRAGEVNEIRL